MARAWLFGNTTVRSPFRLKAGLEALASSRFIGELEGENETEFARLLHEAGIVELNESTTDVSSIARKWRSALVKLGFLVPKVTPITRVSQDEIAPKFTITENGQRLMKANSAPAIQEVFLRAIAAIRLPSPTERDFQEPPFYPFRHTLAIMLKLEQSEGSSHLSFLEMAIVVQLSSPADGLDSLADAILDLRHRRLQAPNKKAFDRGEAEKAANEHGLAWATYFDYADTNIRYFKATGVVQNKGRGIILVPEQRVLARNLIDMPMPALSPVDYLKRLFKGAILPTDELSGALEVLESLNDIAASRGIQFDISGRDLSNPGNISNVRHELESLIFHSKELDFAHDQASRIEEILTLLMLINDKRGSATLANGVEVKLPLNEVPAYFEWALWRFFLALRHYVVKPHELRRFNIDQDFLPMGTATGGGSDVIVEYDDFVIVVEVTLTQSSRQEAAEGEPVRRHVAKAVEEFQASGKTIYGLFIAKKIDSNTAETFRIGVWYQADDSRMTVDIVPLTIIQFHSFVKDMFASGPVHPNQIRRLLNAVIDLRSASSGAPEWKMAIQKEFEINPRGIPVVVM